VLSGSSTSGNVEEGGNAGDTSARVVSADGGLGGSLGRSLGFPASSSQVLHIFQSKVTRGSRSTLSGFPP
jgi:hypothetical protein